MTVKKLDFTAPAPNYLIDAFIQGGKTGNIFQFMPERKDIPEDFKFMHSDSVFAKLQAKWFFEGILDKDFPQEKKGINREEAIRHLSLIQSSWAPKHEHKAEAVAYLMSLWFNEPSVMPRIVKSMKQILGL